MRGCGCTQYPDMIKMIYHTSGLLGFSHFECVFGTHALFSAKNMYTQNLMLMNSMY